MQHLPFTSPSATSPSRASVSTAAGSRWRRRAVAATALLAAAAVVCVSSAAALSCTPVVASLSARRPPSTPPANAGRTLLAITTCNGWHRVDRLLSTSELPPDVDVVVMDDFGDDDPPPTAAFPALVGVRVIRAHAPRGISHAWNLAWAAFVVEGYSALALANDDIVLPRGALAALTAAVLHPAAAAAGVFCVGPATSPRGVGGAAAADGFYRWQNVARLYPGLPASLRGDDPGPGAAQAVQDAVARLALAGGGGGYGDGDGAGADDDGAARVPPALLPITRDAGGDYRSHLLGFLLVLSRGAIPAAAAVGGNLVDPTLVNLGGEADLQTRVRMGVATRAYAYHAKNASFGGGDRDSVDACRRRAAWSPRPTLTTEPTRAGGYYSR